MPRGVNAMRSRYSCLILVASSAILVAGSSGCALFPESMQPKNLQKLNRGNGYSEDPFFSSIPDKEATAARAVALRNAFASESELEEAAAHP
ncbi:MAG: hypothetical protein JWM11_1494 [Planctomycetaceae bacterium]|nr:hypothetical protein [Planctomycetaceae bacterium]